MSHGTMDREHIDIDEFERRLRGPAPRPPGDPLAELARLVTTPETKPEALDAMFARPEAAGRESTGPESIDLSRLRGSHGEPAPASAIDAGYAPVHAHDDPDAMHPAGDEMAWTPDAADRPAPARRSRRPLYMTAAVIGVGLLGISGTFAYKGNRVGTGDLVEVKAASGPVKVQAQASEASPDASATVLDRGVAAQPVVRVVDRQEKPVDLKEAANRAARAGSSQMASLAATAASGGDTSAVFPEPRRVKTVSVRPDGTIMGGAAAAPAAGPAATAPSATPNVAVPLSSSAGAKTATPKTVTRAVTTPKPPVDKPEAAAKPAPKPVAAKPAADKPAPTKVARAAADDAADDTVATTALAARGGGGFVVQLAAPGNEADAKATASRLSRKFSDELGGTRITVQKAGDKDVFRVRTASMSRESAVAACEKIKSSGGACFVAKN